MRLLRPQFFHLSKSFIKLLKKRPSQVFFNYEAAFSNVITGIYFLISLQSSKSAIQEFVENKNGTPITDQSSIFRLRIITWVWVIYFFIKAAIYFYLSSRYTIEQALLIRSTAGTASFYILLTLSITSGKKIILYLQSKNLLPQQ